jgi:hypothetical protein
VNSRRRAAAIFATLALLQGLAACDIPAGPRRPAFPRFEPAGLLESRGAAVTGVEPAGDPGDDGKTEDKDDDDETIPAMAPPEEGTLSSAASTGPMLLPLADDLVAVMPAVADRAWTWRRDGSTTVLSHNGPSGNEDAIVLSLSVPSVLAGWPGVEHFVRWFLVRGSAEELESITRIGWSASLGIGFRAWLPDWAGTGSPDVLALGLLLTEPWSAVAPLVAVPESFTGWRWTGRNPAGLHVRLAQMDATWHVSPASAWAPAVVDGVAASLEGWARRMPSAQARAARLVRRLRLGQVAQPTLTCSAAAAPCTLEMPVAATSADVSEVEPVAALYDDRGRLVARAAAADIETTATGLRWRWRGGRAGTYLLRWHVGGGEPAFDPAKGPHAAVEVGDVAPQPATVAFGYVDAGEPRVRGRFLVAICRAPCAAAQAFASYLDHLRAPSDRELALLRASPEPASPAGPDAASGDFTAELGARLGELARAFATDKLQGREALDAWWHSGGKSELLPVRKDAP